MIEASKNGRRQILIQAIQTSELSFCRLYLFIEGLLSFLLGGYLFDQVLPNVSSPATICYERFKPFDGGQNGRLGDCCRAIGGHRRAVPLGHGMGPASSYKRNSGIAVKRASGSTRTFRSRYFRSPQTPCHSQHIADRGACGKTRVMPQNLRTC